MFFRNLKIQNLLEKNKVLIIYGARQVGKTTLVKSFLDTTSLKYRFYTGDDIEFAIDFGSSNLKKIKQIVENIDLLVIDEAQKIDNIGRSLKLLVDNVDDIYVIATGSSSFDLANITDEPLTGRKNVTTLYPISLLELQKNISSYELQKNLEQYLIYGMYPNVLNYEHYSKKENRITEIKDAYLIKDILEFNKIKKSDIVIKLLKLLSFQIGSEVSTTELGKTLGVDGKTVANYLDLLQKSFVLFKMDGFSSNLRKEITKMSKYYFYDLGIRNALINNFNSFSNRNDQGQLWENFCIIEKIKQNSYLRNNTNYYFWRTYDQQEIDLIQESGGLLKATEFKWNTLKKPKVPIYFKNNYPEASFEVINPNNFYNWLK